PTPPSFPTRRSSDLSWFPTLKQSDEGVCMAGAQQSNLGVLEKAFWFTLNALERRLFSENLIVSNLTPYEEIYRQGIMSVRHYLPLEESDIQVGDRKSVV